MSNSQPGSVSNKRRKFEGPANSLFPSTRIEHDDEPRRKSATPTPDVRQVQDPKLLYRLDGRTIVRRGDHPFVQGGFCDIFIGHHELYGKVAMRRPRMTESGYTMDEVNTFFDESEIWKKLRHPNILQFIGLIQADGYIWAVSHFAENGSLPTYLKRHPETDRRALVLQLADAIRYLHREGVVHGDIKGSNVLISAVATVLLCDFGLSKLSDTHTRSSLKGTASFRWCAPEVLMEREPKSFASDVYSFGMTAYEILSGKMPFHNISNEWLIGMEADKGVRPTRESGGLESGDMDELWNVIVESWDGDPFKRPTMEAVCERLGVPVTLPIGTTAESAFIIQGAEPRSFPSASALAGSSAGRLFAQSPVGPAIHQQGHNTMVQQSNTGRRRMIAGPSMNTSYHTVQTTENGHPTNHVSAETLICGMPRAHARYKDYSTKPSRPCHQGTRVPLLQSIRNWIDDDSATNPIFWLCGEVGVGKTTVAHTIAKEQDALGQLGASFFFNRDNDQRRHPTLFATTIAYQLTRFDTLAHQQVAATLQPDVDIVRQGLEEQFLKLVVQPLVWVGVSSFRKIVIVIDGLDECSDPAALLDVLPLLTKYAVLRLRVLITSRPHAAIVTKFQSPRLCHLTSETHFRNLGSNTLNNDVRAFLEWTLGEIASEYSLPSPWPTLGEVNKLAKIADGLFVIASIFDRYLRDPTEGNPSEQLKRILSRRKVVGSSPTAELDSLYDMVLNDAKRSLPKNDVGFSRRLLQLGLLSEDDCSVGMMCGLLNCTLADMQSVLRRLTSVIPLPSKEWDYITPFHASFGEYIQDRERCSISEFLIEPASTHAELAITFLDIFIHAAEDGVTGLEWNTFDDVPEKLIFSAYQLLRRLPLASNPARVKLQKSKETFCLDAIWIWIFISRLSYCHSDEGTVKDIKKAGLATACGINDEASLRCLTVKRLLHVYREDIAHLSIRQSPMIGDADESESEGSHLVHNAELETFKNGLCWQTDVRPESPYDPRDMVGILSKWSKLDHPNILPLRGIDFESLQDYSNPKLIIRVPSTFHYPTLRRDWYPSLVHAFQQNADIAVETVLAISRAIPYLEKLVSNFGPGAKHIVVEDIVVSKEGQVMIHPLPFVYRQDYFGYSYEWDDLDPPLVDGTGRGPLSECGIAHWPSPKRRNGMVWSFGCVMYEMMSGEPPLKRYHDIVMGSELVDDEPMESGPPLKTYRDFVKTVEMRDPNMDDDDTPRESDYLEYWWMIGVPAGCTLTEDDVLRYRYQTAIDHLLNDLQVSEDLKDILRSCWEVEKRNRPTIENIADRLAAILEALRNQNPEAL